MRRYMASCDDGHDYFTFEYESEYRNNSKGNLEDARNQYRRKHGNRQFKITSTRLMKEGVDY